MNDQMVHVGVYKGDIMPLYFCLSGNELGINIRTMMWNYVCLLSSFICDRDLDLGKSFM